MTAPGHVPTAWLYVGQGAQRRGMGSDYVDQLPSYWSVADRILGFSTREACMADAEGRMRDTRYLQPVMFVLNAIAGVVRRDREPEPDFLAGHSLGELNALFAAGCFDFETGLRLVQRRGELMSQSGGGAMVAIIGLAAERVVEVIADRGLDDVDVSNINSAAQVVISCPKVSVASVSAEFERAGARRCVPLNVSASFHSRAMARAETEFADYLTSVTIGDPRVAVLSNVTAQPHRAGEVAALMSRQIGQPVRWRESMRYLVDHGVREIVEIGPGTTLTGLWESAVDEGPPLIRSAGPVTSPAPPVAGTVGNTGTRGAADLGSAEFRRTYHTRWAYAAGSMFQGIASTAMVARMARGGLLSFFGAGGLGLADIEKAILDIRSEAGQDATFGMNMLFDFNDAAHEKATIALYLRQDVLFIEAAAYPHVTDPLVWFRFRGAYRDGDGRPHARRHIIAKVSRPEVAAAFMRPPAAEALARLVAEGLLSDAEAEIAAVLPASGDICVEADSAGHTDGGVSLALTPSIGRLREDSMRRYRYGERIRVGASGGLGSPEAVAAAFVLGADFVVTGSVNQCTPEAGTSAAVKDMLVGLDVQDTTYAPAGDMFEIGSRVQVVKKGTLFAARANNLYQIYRRCGGLDEIDDRTRGTIADTYFRRSFDDVWDLTCEHYVATGREGLIDGIGRNPKQRMSAVFRWYFHHSARAAMAGEVEERVNFQIHCGPAMGAFNRFCSDSGLAGWRDRHVDVVADLLMVEATHVLERFRS